MPYKTVRAPAVYSFTVEKSEFIAKIAPLSSSEDAAGFIDSVRAEHRRARHNCYAYVLRDGFESRFSDDGEPQGTAGQPILDVIKKNGITDAGIVVTRYFGGILLGKGGLTRAYSQAASGAVQSADVLTMTEAREVAFSLDYSLYDRVVRLIPEFGAKTVSQDFADSISLRLLIRDELCGGFCARLSDISNGRLTPSVSDVRFADFGGEAIRG